jgi:hypothetical protein
MSCSGQNLFCSVAQTAAFANGGACFNDARAQVELAPA